MKATVTANGVCLYERNTGMSYIVGHVNKGDELDLEAEYGEWAKLTDGGWIRTCFTEPTELGGGGGGESPYKTLVVSQVVQEVERTYLENGSTATITYSDGTVVVYNWDESTYEIRFSDGRVESGWIDDYDDDAWTSGANITFNEAWEAFDSKVLTTCVRYLRYAFGSEAEWTGCGVIPLIVMKYTDAYNAETGEGVETRCLFLGDASQENPGSSLYWTESGFSVTPPF